jgi:CheY-like chemotaxis protein
MANKVCLLIEDSKIQANIIMQMISKLGWNVFTALNLEQGLRILKNEGVDFVLTDLILPDCAGLETVAKIKELAPNCVVAAMTAGDTKKEATEILKNARAQGAEFLLQKPFDAPRLAQVLEQAITKLEQGSTMPLALVVDDSSTIRAVCDKMLKAGGFRTVLAESLDEAFETIDNFDLDVILTDLNMPGISPIDALPYIREALPGVGLVVMTGQSQDDLHKTMQLGADTTITKPFQGEQLVQTLKKAMLIASTNFLKTMQNSQ